jgi:hypothetical protein
VGVPLNLHYNNHQRGFSVDVPSNQLITSKGRIGLVIAVATVVIFLVAVPVTRLFFAISLGIGIVVAVMLYLWNKLHPVKAEDVDDKHPLKLDL